MQHKGKYIPESFTPIPEYYREYFFNGEVVAAGNVVIGDGLVYILNFEVREKGKGIGRAIIETYLKDCDVEGVSTKSACRFWISVGAEMDKDRNFKIKKRKEA